MKYFRISYPKSTLKFLFSSSSLLLNSSIALIKKCLCNIGFFSLCVFQRLCFFIEDCSNDLILLSTIFLK